MPTLDIAQLVAEHHGIVYRYAYRLTGAAADAEDLTQQTFLLAQANLRQLRDSTRAVGWLCSILRNAHHKSRRQRRPLAAADLELLVEDLPDELPVESLVDEERLQGALDELPIEFKTVLLMFYFEDKSYREISQELEVPTGTVMSRLSRAKAHLRARLLEAELYGVGGNSHGSTNDRG